MGLLTGLPGRTGLEDGLVVPSQRGRMLDAITAAVAEKGYAATTVADVIARAGVSRKTFYAEFKDKENCYLAAYQLGTDYLIARIVRADDPTQELPQRTAGLLNVYLRGLAQSPLAARAFLAEVRAAGAAVQERRIHILQQFSDLFREGPDVETDPALAPMLRAALAAAIEELVAREIVAGRTAELPALEAQLSELAIRVLSAR